MAETAKRQPRPRDITAVIRVAESNVQVCPTCPPARARRPRPDMWTIGHALDAALRENA